MGTLHGDGSTISRFDIDEFYISYQHDHHAGDIFPWDAVRYPCTGVIHWWAA
jgi:hypothetical protein